MTGPSIPSRALLPFFVIAFGLAWGLVAMFVVAPEAAQGLFGDLSATHPLFILAVYAPAIAALVVITAYAGIGAIVAFLRRLLLWRLSWRWIAFVVLAIPAIATAGAVLKGGPVGLAIPEEGLAALVGPVPFPAQQPALAGRAALGHVSLHPRRNGRRGAELAGHDAAWRRGHGGVAAPFRLRAA